MKDMKTIDDKKRIFFDGIVCKAKQLFMQKTKGQKVEELNIKLANTEEVYYK